MLEDSVWWKRHAQCTCDFFNRAKRTYNIKGGFGSNNVITIIIVIIRSSFWCVQWERKLLLRIVWIGLDQICVCCRREMSRGRSDSGGWLRGCLVVFAVVSALGVCGPALYWRFKNAISLRNSHNKFSCPPCLCNCPPPLSLFQLAPGSYLFPLASDHATNKKRVFNWLMNEKDTHQLFADLFLFGCAQDWPISLSQVWVSPLLFHIFIWFLF